MNNRYDRLTELLVGVAINIAAWRGIAAGDRALAELEIPLDVVHSAARPGADVLRLIRLLPFVDNR